MSRNLHVIGELRRRKNKRKRNRNRKREWDTTRHEEDVLCHTEDVSATLKKRCNRTRSYLSLYQSSSSLRK